MKRLMFIICTALPLAGMTLTCAAADGGQLSTALQEEPAQAPLTPDEIRTIQALREGVVAEIRAAAGSLDAGTKLVVNYLITIRNQLGLDRLKPAAQALSQAFIQELNSLTRHPNPAAPEVAAYTTFLSAYNHLHSVPLADPSNPGAWGGRLERTYSFPATPPAMTLNAQKKAAQILLQMRTRARQPDFAQLMPALITSYLDDTTIGANKTERARILATQLEQALNFLQRIEYPNALQQQEYAALFRALSHLRAVPAESGWGRILGDGHRDHPPHLSPPSHYTTSPEARQAATTLRRQILLNARIPSQTHPIASQIQRYLWNTTIGSDAFDRAQALSTSLEESLSRLLQNKHPSPLHQQAYAALLKAYRELPDAYRSENGGWTQYLPRKDLPSHLPELTPEEVKILWGASGAKQKTEKAEQEEKKTMKKEAQKKRVTDKEKGYNRPYAYPAGPLAMIQQEEEEQEDN